MPAQDDQDPNYSFLIHIFLIILNAFSAMSSSIKITQPSSHNTTIE